MRRSAPAPERGQSRMPRIVRVGLTMAAPILLTACATAGGSATERTICRELARDLPTWSDRDTPETLRAGARFVNVFRAVCPDTAG